MPAAAIEQPWTRLSWIIPCAILLWVMLLTIFGLLLERTAPPAPELAPTQVQIVELPPTGGLQGGPAAPAAPKPKSVPVKPHPRVRVERPVVVHHPRIHHIARPKIEPIPPSINGTAKSTEEEAPAASAPAAANAKGSSSGGGVPGGSGSGSGSGLGSDSGGARAVFAPKPEIPDDLREQLISTVAVAHFTVSYDGQSEVSLTTPTNNPELNEILLETLKQWRFFPAMKNGVAINSEFDVRIPVRVQ
ncbi:MAG TPA: TonB family protein [Candidatus Binataceae bacterium]|nr:TonB family protein [Candidatus Binataceae bacterium]